MELQIKDSSGTIFRADLSTWDPGTIAIVQIMQEQIHTLKDEVNNLKLYVKQLQDKLVWQMQVLEQKTKIAQEIDDFYNQ